MIDFSSGAFSNNYEAIGRHVCDPFGAAVRPADLKIGFFGCAESEVKPKIVRRVKAGLAQHFLGLHLAAVVRGYTRADCAAVRLRPDKLDLGPMCCAA